MKLSQLAAHLNITAQDVQAYLARWDVYAAPCLEGRPILVGDQVDDEGVAMLERLEAIRTAPANHRIPIWHKEGVDSADPGAVSLRQEYIDSHYES